MVQAVGEPASSRARLVFGLLSMTGQTPAASGPAKRFLSVAARFHSCLCSVHSALSVVNFPYAGRERIGEALVGMGLCVAVDRGLFTLVVLMVHPQNRRLAEEREDDV